MFKLSSQSISPLGSSLDEPLDKFAAFKDAADTFSSRCAAMGTSSDAPLVLNDDLVQSSFNKGHVSTGFSVPPDKSSAHQPHVCPVTRSLRAKSACKPPNTLKGADLLFPNPEPGVNNKRKMRQERPINTRFRQFEGVPIS